MPRTLAPVMSLICQAAGLSHETAAAWQAANILLPPTNSTDRREISRLDVMAAAVSAELRRNGVSDPALKTISERIYAGAAILGRHQIAVSSIPAITYHGVLRMAETEGRFQEIAAANSVDPTARLFPAYLDYLQWCHQCGLSPSDEEERLLGLLEPDDLALLPYCHDLLDETASREWSVLWDIIMFDGTPLLYSRRSSDPPPRDIVSGEEAACWISVSITAVDRAVGRRGAATR